MAQSKLKQIERLDNVKMPETPNTKSFHTNFEPETKSAELVLSAKDLTIGYNKPLSTLSLNIMRGEKIGIIGGNGLGKSTFLKTITNRVPPLSGTFTIGDRVKIGYFDQQMAQFKSGKNVLENFGMNFRS